MSAKLTTLEFSVHSKISKGLIRLGQDNLQLIQDELLQIDTQLKTIPPLDRVVVRTFGETPAPSVIEFMQGLGWVVLRSHGKLGQ